MRQNPSEFKVFFEDEEFEQYLHEMSLPGTWGDELTIRAIADYFQCVVHILTTTESNYYLRYIPRFSDGTDNPIPNRHLFFTYISPIHYNSFKLKNVEAGESIHSCHDRLLAERKEGKTVD